MSSEARRQRRLAAKERLKAPPIPLRWAMGGDIIHNRCFINIQLCRPQVPGRRSRILPLTNPVKIPAPADREMLDGAGKKYIEVCSAPIMALIDTGATASAIHRDFLKIFGLPILDVGKVGTAADAVDAPFVGVGVLFPPTDGGHLPMQRNLRVAAMNLGPEAMLFGMDLLDRGILVVDRVNQKWTWELVDAGFLRMLAQVNSPR